MESKKIVLMIYLQSSNGEADLENRLVDTMREGKGVMS